MECIITRSVNDYQLSRIPVYTPIEMLKIIGKENISNGI
jgi:hypothetical protein